MLTSLLRELVVVTPVILETYDQLQNSVNRYLPVSVRTNISETVKRNLSLGVLRRGEDVKKVSQCYLSTTSGPLAGFLFISTDKVAFCSERSMKVFTQKCHMLRIRYKVATPLKKIKFVNQSKNVQKPTQKYIEIVTENLLISGLWV
ncbi:hypothetical protein GLYMA_20G101800v4 [Glycine max]|uniref:GRAM domain-containing protein n=1 Tax=Glycine max TaxID=3847 RepID=A0A0R0E9F4_SOYBN|nr:hypothetical protein GLYMA_20G101800v4 [Glycine max]